MNLPKDSMMMLSVVNTKLRDYYKNLDSLCEDLGINPNEIKESLRGIGYEYDEELNRFV